jgi:uncharacterized protein (DUF983 family)
MRATPFGILLQRCLRGRCPVCGQGPLFASVLSLRQHCPECGYRYQRAVEYGSGGFVTGAMSINLVLTGLVAAVAVIYVAATGLAIPLWVQLAVGIAWTIVFPLAFHRLAVGVWVALDLWFNPPLDHELAAAPPRPPRD